MMLSALQAPAAVSAAHSRRGRNRADKPAAGAAQDLVVLGSVLSALGL